MPTGQTHYESRDSTDCAGQRAQYGTFGLIAIPSRIAVGNLPDAIDVLSPHFDVSIEALNAVFLADLFVEVFLNVATSFVVGLPGSECGGRV